ncbi:MAG TPA: hypothetical protein H9900_02210 [Candidatus Monoglobus merdigallinarum]|uniref:Uncharacterized protein n=1 Tax=Candidatus Monoglobus merdigallinarum TaxID=2838698 RepID=A0A9D1TLA6_9FIRM|nr:hypothetical protein [Candidatus Monoglobus merdigallinarum]
MDINELTKNLDQNKLNNALKQFESIMSKDEMNTILNTLKNTNAATLKNELNKIDPATVNGLLKNNPQLQKAVSSNPEAAKTLDSIIKKNK